MGPPVVLVDASPQLEEQLSGLPDIELLRADPAAGTWERDVGRAVVVVVGADADDPVSRVQRIHRTAPGARVLVAVDPDRARQLHDRLQFAPFVPATLQVVPDDPAELVPAVRAALARAQRAEQFQEVVERIQTSDQLQARLEPFNTTVLDSSFLDLLPIGLLLLDRQGRVLSYSRPAQALLALPPTAKGRPLEEQLDTGGQALADALARARRDASPVPVELELQRAGQRSLLEGTVQRRPGNHREVYLVAVHDVTSEREAERLRARAAAAEAANEAKSSFLAALSHETRTPLNAVLGMAELLERTGLDHEQRSYLRTLTDSAELLLQVLSDVLDLTKIESGMLEIHEAAFDPRTLLEDTMAALAPSADTKGLSLGYRIDPRVPSEVTGDPRRLRQALVNLVGNAIKFTDEGGVVVSMTPGEPPIVRLEVRDTGTGISEEALERIFEPFERGGRVDRPGQGGLGLGLAITNRLVDLMGGAVGVESSPGQGATFTVDLPLAPAVGAGPPRAEAQPDLRRRSVVLVEAPGLHRQTLSDQLRDWGMDVALHSDLREIPRATLRDAHLVVLDTAPDQPRSQVVVDELRARGLDAKTPVLAMTTTNAPLPASDGEAYDMILSKPVRHSILLEALATGGADEPTPGGRAGEEPVPGRRPLSVLVAEDNATNRFLTQELLRHLGHEPTVVENGQEALDAVLDGDFDMVLMDVSMPVMDGLEATERLREALPPEHRPVVVALTAHAMAGDRERYLEAGFDEYLSKPFDLEDLQRVLEEGAMRVRGPHPAPPVVDISELRRQRREDPTALRAGLRTLGRRVAELEQAHRSGDQEAVARAAATLARAAEAVHAPGLRQASEGLAQRARDAEMAPDRIEEVTAMAAHARRVLRDQLEGQPSA